MDDFLNIYTQSLINLYMESLYSYFYSLVQFDCFRNIINNYIEKTLSVLNHEIHLILNYSIRNYMSRVTNINKTGLQISLREPSLYNINDNSAVGVDSVSSSDSDDNIKKNINGYIIDDAIGYGSCGKVYTANNNGVKYAIKIIKNIIKHNNKYAIQYEIAIMKKLNHRNIISLKDAILDINRNTIYLVMEYAKNGSILKLVNDKYKPLEKKQILNYSVDIINGLNYLHSHHIIHRDIKPANILINDNDEAMLIDFGTCVFDGSGAVHDFKGTINFMAPEIINGEDATYASDIWSFGITLFLMIYGEFPFEADDRTRGFSMMKSIINNDIKFPRTPTFDEKEVFDALLEKDQLMRIELKKILDLNFFKSADRKLSNSSESSNDTFQFDNNIFINNYASYPEKIKQKKNRLKQITNFDIKKSITLLEKHDSIFKDN